MGIRRAIHRIFRRFKSDEQDALKAENIQKGSADDENKQEALQKSDDEIKPETVPAGDTTGDSEKLSGKEIEAKTKSTPKEDVEKRASSKDETYNNASVEQPESSTARSLQHTLSKKDLLCKFVVQGNKKIGETISVDSGHLVLKNKAEKLCIPLSSIIEITADDVLVGEFDRDVALQRGEEWTKRTTDKLHFDEKGMLIND
jgi:hypothetical protein